MASDEDMDQYCDRVRIPMLLLEWITERLSARQRHGDERIDAIESDFKHHVKNFGFESDFRFDRDEVLLVLAQPIIINGVEAVGRSIYKDKIIQFLECPLKDKFKERKQFETTFEQQIDPISNYDEYPMWCLSTRLRNSLSHSRYKYNPDGYIEFTDFNKTTQTARFVYGVYDTMSFAYAFAGNCILWRDSKNKIVPSS